jgi:hypothetical protein
MAERTLTERELNRALLARQFLLERRRMPIPRALERLGTIQMQYAPSGYLGLWSRLEGLRRDDLTVALERRRAVQGTLQRITIHLTSPRDFAVFATAIRDARRAWWLRLHPDVRHRAMETAAARVRELLREGPLRQRELVSAVRAEPAVWTGAALWIDLLRVPPSGTWDRRRADLYGLAEGVVPTVSVTRQEAVDVMVRRYLAGFGPAAPKDIAGWAGLPLAHVTAALSRTPLRRFRDEAGAELVDLPGAPLPPANTPAPVRFLPTWDATLLVHQRRTQILPEPLRPSIFNTRTPHSVPTFLVDGRVAGTWRHADGRVRAEPFAPLPRAARRELAEETERLEAFLV